MKKTAITIATAASFTLFAGSLTAGEENKDKTRDSGAVTTQGGTGTTGTTQGQGMGQTGQGQGQGMEQAGTMDADTVMERYDLDNNDELDEEELSVFGATAAGQPGAGAGEDRGEQLMDRLDKDGDGSVTKEELKESDMLKEGQEGSGTQQMQ